MHSTITWKGAEFLAVLYNEQEGKYQMTLTEGLSLSC